MSGTQGTGNKTLSTHAEFVAYLEKHRIYELFFELATQLVIQKPDDHLAFMKQYLHVASKKRDVPRIILIAPPTFDSLGLANILQEEVGVCPLTLNHLRHACPVPDGGCRCEESEDLALTMKKMLESGAMHHCGWVLVDVPRSKKEASAFQRIGIIPTHVIQLIPSSESETWKKICTDTDCHAGIGCTKASSKNLEQRRYLKNLAGLKETYANYLIEVEVGVRSIEELGKDCAKLTKTKKHYGAPSLFRIALIGSRGSGCTTIARYISERFNLVHSNFVTVVIEVNSSAGYSQLSTLRVGPTFGYFLFRRDNLDYDSIAEQARLQQTPLGEMLRMFEYKWGERPKPEIRIQVIEKYLSSYECIKRGWILTGYPKSVDDFKLLDAMSTPPNRVIFMETNGDVCRERLLNRRYNIHTGSKHNLSSKDHCENDDCELGIHPRDYRMIVERDLQEYEENVTAMMEYAGESALKIDGNCEERIVRERLEACLIQPPPRSKPREPKAPTIIDPMDVEFEPDDEPDFCASDDKRSPEPKYTFV